MNNLFLRIICICVYITIRTNQFKDDCTTVIVTMQDRCEYCVRKKVYFYKNLWFPLVIHDLRFSCDNCSQECSRSVEWDAKAIACQETRKINGFAQVSRRAKSKARTFGNCADTKVIFQDRAMCRSDEITGSNFAIYAESYIAPGDFLSIIRIIKGIIKTCNMIEYN